MISHLPNLNGFTGRSEVQHDDRRREVSMAFGVSRDPLPWIGHEVSYRAMAVKMMLRMTSISQKGKVLRPCPSHYIREQSL